MKQFVSKIAAAVTCLMMAAVIFVPAVTQIAHAETTHTHSFANGRCDCGAALFEAEDADLSGSVSSDPEATCVGANAAASGGKLVNNWAVEGNEIVWTFSIDKAATAPVELVMSPCEGATTFSSTLSLTVNGAEVALKEDAIRGIDGDKYHNYSAFETEDVSFAKGDVRVVLKAKRAYNVNIDCIRVDLAAADDVCVGAFNKVSSSEHTHIFEGGKCACGALLFEAEDGAIQGTPTFDNPDFKGKNRNAHGGRLVGNWGNGDNLLTWTLNADAAMTGTKIDLVLASCTESGGFNLPTDVSQSNGVIAWPFELRTERTENGGTVKNTVSWQSNDIAPMPADNWHDYRVYTSKPVDFAAGETLIRLESYNGYMMNIDYIVVSPAAAAEPEEPGHTHGFADGRCECGYALMEAETADLSGSRSSDPNETCFGENAAASGGALVKNWAVAGNKIVWRFRIDREVTAPIELMMSPCEAATTFSSTLSLTVNGVGVSMKDDSMRGLAGELYHNYTAFETVPVGFAKGNVEIALQAKRAYNVNIDCLRIGFTPEVTIGDYEHRIEAEAGEVTGTGSDEGAPMIGEHSASSGGGLVKNFATKGNRITWKFDLDKDYENVPLTVYMASCESSDRPVSAVALTVNGTAASFTEQSIPALDGENYYGYRAFTAGGIALGAHNIIVFENVAGININVDYIKLGLPAGAVVSEYSEPVPGHEHSFTDGVCACGTVRLEAENAVIAGTPTGNDSFLEQNDKSSGGWCVAGWSEGDNILTFEFEASKACDDVAVGFTFAPCGGIGVNYTLPTTTEGAAWDNKGGAFWPFLLRVNGVGQGFTSDDVPLYGEDGNYYNWQTVKTNPVALKEGKNVVEIEACDYYAMNLDYITIGVPADVAVNMEVLDNAPPAIGTITVEPAEPQTGSEVAFSFTVSDNVTPVDKLTVEVKVYLNYGKPAQSEIACVNYKFTPAEAGKYTIVVSAADAAGQTAQKVRAITVTAAADDPSDPNDPNDDPPGGDTPDETAGCNGCNSSVSGTLIPLAIFGTCFAAFIIIKTIVKKNKDQN